MEFEGRPKDGSSLQPGKSETWDLKYGFSIFGGVQYAANFSYKVQGTDAVVDYNIYTYSTSNESSCKVTPAAPGLALDVASLEREHRRCDLFGGCLGDRRRGPFEDEQPSTGDLSRERLAVADREERVAATVHNQRRDHKVGQALAPARLAVEL